MRRNKDANGTGEKRISVFMLEYMLRLGHKRMEAGKFAYTLSELGRLEQYLHDHGLKIMSAVTMATLDDFRRDYCGECQTVDRLQAFIRYAKRTGYLCKRKQY